MIAKYSFQLFRLIFKPQNYYFINSINTERKFKKYLLVIKPKNQ